MSGFIRGEDRFQATLFPERLDDYVAAPVLQIRLRRIAGVQKQSFRLNRLETIVGLLLT